MSSITLNLEIPLTSADRAVLETLLGARPAGETITATVTPAPPEEPKKAPAKKAPAKKAAPKKETPAPEPDDDEPDEFASDEAVKESAPKKKAPVKKETPADVDEQVAQEEIEAVMPEKEGGDKRKTAIDLGAAALGEGRADDVRAALGSLGASRVSQLKDDQLDAFIEALS